MNEYVKFLIEFAISFVVVFIFYYFTTIRQYKKLDKKKVPVEVNLILRYNKIDLKKINYKNMLIMVACVTSFIIALILTVLYRFTNSNVLIAIITILVSLPIALVAYDLIGRHFAKQSQQEENNVVDKKKK